jgi:hypothetical protein
LVIGRTGYNLTGKTFIPATVAKARLSRWKLKKWLQPQEAAIAGCNRKLLAGGCSAVRSFQERASAKAASPGQTDAI